MFTGIVEEVGKVVSARSGKMAIVARDILQGVALGESINVNGVCLTVTDYSGNSFSVGIMPETLRRTNLGLLSPGDKVNLERALSLGGKLGGHLVQGHIDSTGGVSSIRREGQAAIIGFDAPPEIMRYVVEKGFIAVDGISLTVTERSTDSFQVSIVEYTHQHTNLAGRRVGDVVNLEVDIIAKYVEQLSQAHGSGITTGFLQEHGFLVG
jgi:riboflavin synthase